jgi:5'-3' exonuclease
MGVPGLFASYYRRYKKESELLSTLEKLCKSNIEYLFFDYNSLIHPCAQQVLSANYNKYIMNLELNSDEIENDIITNCINYTQFIINSINVKNVYIIIDGVAPRSKISQQRERRYKSHFFRDIELSSKSIWDSNKITPGTIFMEKLILKLRIWADSLSNIYVKFSDSNEPGEGEHKMMKIIEKLPINKEISIYGLDSDLIFLSMLNKKSDSIILIRDTSFQEEQKNAGIDYLNIKQLKSYIIKDLLYLHPNKNLDQDNLIQDYVLLCFFLGNDFLDHLYPLYIRNHGIDIILKAYIKAYNNHQNSYLVKLKNLKSNNWKDCININFLKDILYQLKNFEEHYIKQNRKLLCKINIEKLVDINNQENSKLYFYTNINKEYVSPETLRSTYYNFYGITDIIDDVCFNYIEGLYWILGYYNGHVHNNWSWYYKYFTVPFCKDLFDYTRKNNNNSNLQLKINNVLFEDKPFSNIKQLCLVLPKISMIKECKLNNKFRKIMNIINDKNKYMSNLFPDKLYVDITNKEFLYQSKILFEPINEELLDVIL